MKFRKKPVEIEAKQFTLEIAYDPDKAENLASWCGGLFRGTKLPAKDRVIRIDTLEGEMEASVGDWIIRGVKGEHYPCKPDIFDLTYEPVIAEIGGALRQS